MLNAEEIKKSFEILNVKIDNLSTTMNALTLEVKLNTQVTDGVKRTVEIQNGRVGKNEAVIYEIKSTISKLELETAKKLAALETDAKIEESRNTPIRAGYYKVISIVLTVVVMALLGLVFIKTK